MLFAPPNPVYTTHSSDLHTASISFAYRNVTIAPQNPDSDEPLIPVREIAQHEDEGNAHRHFQEHWKSLAFTVDNALRESINRLGIGCPLLLRNAVEYSLLSPGKRLRPVLCLLACEALGGKRNLAIPSACAVEMIHCYSLIHDDLPAMDDDDLRRGRNTCHREFDEATAILAGDALQPLAFETILSSPLSTAQKAESCLILARAAGAEGMVGGQMDDLLEEQRADMIKHVPDRPHNSSEHLASIHRRKTGAMIEASVLLGALAANATTECQDAMGRYGRGIGIAFQITDDLLDVESTAENTGKATGKDAERGKLTFPGLYGIEESRRMAQNHVAEAIRSLDWIGQKAEGLRQLAMYILERKT